MSRLKQAFLTFSVGNIAFYCVYSAVFFVTYFIDHRGFPLLISYFTFWLAVIITRLLAGRRMYILVIVLAHAAGFFLSSLLILRAFYDPAGYWFDIGWLAVLLSSPRSVADTLTLFLIIAGTISLWIFAVRFGLNKGGYQNTIKILENSVFVLFFIAMMAGFVKADIPQLPLYILAVFLWGSLSAALTKNESWGLGSKSGHSSYRLIFFFMAGLFISIFTIVAFLMDYLKWAAATGFDLVKTAVDPLSPYLIALLKALFSLMGYRVKQDPAGTSAPEQGISVYRPVEVSGGDGFILQILMGIFILLVSLLLVFFLIALGKMLLTKRERNDHRASLGEMLGEVWQEFLALLRNIVYRSRMLFSYNRSGRLVERVYTKLVRWGTFRGVGHWPSDTPYEYTGRLSEKYNHFSTEFNMIAECFCAEIYGGKPLSHGEEVSLIKAWKRIRRI